MSRMGRLLYEHSVSTQGYLIVPFVYGKLAEETVYSYSLLSELGHQGEFHTVENPADRYSASLEGIITIATEHLLRYSDIAAQEDYFQYRYLYRNHLIITHRQAHQWFYDHYPPDELRNIAAPRLFRSEQDCISWIKQGLDRSNPPADQVY